MVRSMFSGVAGLRSHQTKMDVIGNNIANVNTYGFKAARVTFRDALYQTLRSSNDPTASKGGNNAMQAGYGPKVASIDTIYGVGSYAQTDYALDCMINGEGFFLVGNYSDGVSSDDVSSLYLTRVGDFSFDGGGNLVDGNGYMVYGFSYTGDNAVPDPADPAGGAADDFDYDTVVPIQYDPDDYPMGLRSIRLAEDGTIFALDKATNTEVTLGKVALAHVPNPSGLEQANNSYLLARGNTGVVTAEAPGANGAADLTTGGLEMAQVDLAKEFSDMITTQRGFQACSKIITTTDEMLNELVNIRR